MNKSHKNKLTKWICILLACVLLCSHLSPTLVYAHSQNDQSVEWDGISTEKSWQMDRCLITFLLTDYWADGYTAMITIQNTSDTNIENWHVSFPLCEEIKDLWNAQIIKDSEDNIIFKNLGWNQDININQSVSFGFTSVGAFTGFPEICELPATLQSVPENDFELTYEITDTWDTGYNATIKIDNTSQDTIEDWQLYFDFPYTITDLWDGELVSLEDNNYLVKNNTYNQNIAPNENVTISFTVNSNNTEDTPNNFSLQEITISCETNSGQEPDEDEDDNPDQDITSGDSVSSGDIEKDVQITIDTSSFSVNETWNMYFTEEKLEYLSGTLTEVQKVNKFSYTITDINTTTVDSGEIEIAEHWEITPVGLVLGANCITITALCEQEEIIETQIYLMNFNEENMNTANVDLSDSDGDNINNYYETILGTDLLLDDTDGDGLLDFDEISKTGTNPTLVDTDNNETPDGQEDFDEDGLCNLDEMYFGTGPLYPDSDNDGLSDSAEVCEYFTNPNDEDHDKDGLLDGKDVELGYDPLNPDTDGDTILDGDEVSTQTQTITIDQEETAGILEVSVTMNCTGSIDNKLLIQNVYNLDMRTTEVVGRIGAPVVIETEEEFEEAIISFTYDETVLGETLEENLRIMWYDSENDKYIILDEETILDTENNTLSYKTDHFSTWLVVDRETWWVALEVDLGYEDLYNTRSGYGDTLLSVDVSNQMTSDKFAYQKTILHDIIDNISASNLSILSYDSQTWNQIGFTSDTTKLHDSVNKMSVHSANCVPINGLLTPMRRLMSRQCTDKTLIFFFSGGEHNFTTELTITELQYAKEHNIQIHCIVFSDDIPQELITLSYGTRGACYSVTSAEDAANIVSQIGETTLQNALPTDNDEDGLPDIIEEKGVRLSNGTIVYTDPYDQDSNNNDIYDFLEVGGLPQKETHIVDGKEIDTLVSRGGAYTKLSSDFIYVDGRTNENGKTYDEKMDYISYSGRYKRLKYEHTWTPNLFDRSKQTVGDAGIHRLYADRFERAYPFQKNEYSKQYAALNTIVLLIIQMSSYDDNIVTCYKRYIEGNGGQYMGCTEKGTREYLLSNYMIMNNFSSYDSINNYFDTNMQTAKVVAESILSEHNTEIYIALSPQETWRGCQYVNYTSDKLEDWVNSAYAVASNISAFGIFNSADASITLHCTYDPTNQQYTMEYVYYIIDYYDYTAYTSIMEQDALGLARTYELFGYCPGKMTWVSNKKPIIILDGYK